MINDGCTFKMGPKEASCCGVSASDVWSPHVSDSLRFFCIGSKPLLKLIVVEDLVNTFSNNSVASLIFSCHFVSVLYGKHPLSVA